jgi:hypothetical protein
MGKKPHNPEQVFCYGLIAINARAIAVFAAITVRLRDQLPV